GTAVHISFLHPFRLAVCRMFFINPNRLIYCFCRLRIRRLLDRLRRCIFITLLYCCLFCIPGILLLSQRSCCDRSCKKYRGRQKPVFLSASSQDLRTTFPSATWILPLAISSIAFGIMIHSASSMILLCRISGVSPSCTYTAF